MLSFSKNKGGKKSAAKRKIVKVLWAPKVNGECCAYPAPKHLLSACHKNAHSSLSLSLPSCISFQYESDMGTVHVIPCMQVKVGFFIRFQYVKLFKRLSSLKDIQSYYTLKQYFVLCICSWTHNLSILFAEAFEVSRTCFYG